MTHTVRATILQTPTPDALEVLVDQLVTVADDGRIASIATAGDTDTATTNTATAGTKAATVLPSTTVLVPGLIDTHLHAPQWPQLGTGLDLPLERWLFERTFPLEATFADLAFSRTVWNDMVPTLLAAGTTTAVYYGSTHEPATTALAEACHAHGQRAYVGRVAMDHPAGTPDWYRDSSARESVDASHRSVESIQALTGRPGLVHPIITPRFIPACSDAALEGLGELATATASLIQTHVSESDWEHGYVLDRYGVSDTEALIRFGLIQDHTVLAHGVHIGAEDALKLRQIGAGVAHCPLSNSYFGNAVFPARRWLNDGLRIGLGTDVAGGPESSLMRQCGHAVTSSRMLEDGVEPSTSAEARGAANARIDITTAFHLATVGGADLLGIDAGLLAVGNVFDALAIDIGAAAPTSDDDWAVVFEKLVRTGSNQAITTVWVDGVDVTPTKR